MASLIPGPTGLNREYPQIRAWLIQLAAAMDRVDRESSSDQSALSEEDNIRRKEIAAAIEVLGQDRSDRAEQLQLIFSLPFDAEWRTRFGL